MADAVPTAKPADAKPVAAKPAQVTAPPAPQPQPKSQPKAESTPAPVQAKTEPTRPAPVREAAPKPAKPAARRKPAAKKTTAPLPPAAKAAPKIAKEPTMDTIKNTTETATAKAKSMMADANDRTKAAMEKSQQMFGEMNEFSKGNVEAMVESSKIAAKGMEAMGQDAVAYAKKSFEEATAAAKQMASVKSPAELMKLQSDYVRASFDSMVAHTSKSTEAMLKLAGEIAQPISNRVSLAAEKVKVAA